MNVDSATPTEARARSTNAGWTRTASSSEVTTMPAAASLKTGALPIGLAHKVKLKNDVAHGAVVRWTDVEIDAGNETIKIRRAMEEAFSSPR